MTKRLTLTAESKVIAEAKRLAAENNTTVSAMFSRLILGMARQRRSSRKLGPITRKVAGSLVLPKGRTLDDLRAEALEEKYGLKK